MKNKIINTVIYLCIVTVAVLLAIFIVEQQELQYQKGQLEIYCKTVDKRIIDWSKCNDYYR